MRPVVRRLPRRACTRASLSPPGSSFCAS
jgi:hypothetical protein